MNALKPEDVRLISSGQVITGVIDCIKELLENALDAGAKNLKIKLVESGLSSITVTDDGCGIPINGRENVAHPYTTSKISSIQDLTNELSTFGFRGEALHAICAQAKVTITTRTHSEEIAQKLTFNVEGSITKTESVTANFGTTIVVSDLMACFPVRRLSESSRITKESLNTFFIRYFLAVPNVRFTIEAPPIYSTTRSPLPSLSQAVAREFGQKVAGALSERKAEAFSGDIKIKLTALFPSSSGDWRDSSTCQKQASGAQILLVNGRPVKNTDITERVNKFYQSKFRGPKRYPRFVISLDFFRDSSLCSSLFEVNLDAAKSAALFVDASCILKLIDQAMASEKHGQSMKMAESYPSGISFSPNPIINTLSGLSSLDSNADMNFQILSEGSRLVLEDLKEFKWVDVGKFADFSIFQVSNGAESNFILCGKTEGLFESIGIPTADSSRLSEAELIMIHFDKLMAKNAEKRWIFSLGDLQMMT